MGEHTPRGTQNRQGEARKRGYAAEATAARYLEEHGFEILDRNFYTQWGEIDLVARDPHGVIAFVEVKYRATIADGGGLAAITPRKLARIRLVCGLWLAGDRAPHGDNGDIRVDVIDVGPAGVRDHLRGVW